MQDCKRHFHVGRFWFFVLAFTWLALAFAKSGYAQGSIAWRSTHTLNGGYNQGSCVLAHAEARVVARAGYLDVEEEVEIGVVGQVSSGVDGESLEIFGSFSLAPGSAIQGALLWNGNQILEAKLLDRKKADSLYEEVVDRNSTPPVRPRDPVVIEAMGNGVYQFKIYPVKINQVRRLRLRMLIPAQAYDLSTKLPLRLSFSGLFGSQNSQIAVTVVAGEDVASLQAQEGNGLRTLTLPSVLLLGTYAMAASQYTWLQLPGTRISSLATTHFSGGAWKGHYLTLVAAIPDELLYRYRTGRRVLAKVRKGEANLELEAVCNTVNCQPISFSGKSGDAWGSSLGFSLIDESGTVILTTQKELKNAAAAENDSSVAVLWAASPAPFSEDRLPPLGATYAFVDRHASLLALESDTLPFAIAARYADQGVPRFAVQDVEIVLPDYEPGQILDPNNPGFPGIPTAIAQDKLKASLVALAMGQGQYELFLARDLAGQEAELVIYDLQGMKVRTMRLRVGMDGWVRLSGSGLKGTYLMTIRAKGLQTSRRLVLP